MKAFVTGGAGFIGSNLVDRLLARGDEVVAYDNLSTGQREFLRDALANPRFALVEGDVLDGDALDARPCAAPTSCSTWRPTPTCGSASSTRERISSRTRSRRSTCSRRCAQAASSASPSPRPARSTASRGVPDARGRAVPGADVALRRVEARRRGADQRLLRGLRLPGWIFRFVSILGERYTHGHVFDFYKRLRDDPHAAARARQRQAAQVVPLRAGLHRRDLHRHRARRGEDRPSSTSAPTSTAR